MKRRVPGPVTQDKRGGAWVKRRVPGPVTQDKRGGVGRREGCLVEWCLALIP